MAGPRALHWVEERALLVADLHLEKASAFARHGQMLPPYDSRETLERLGVAQRATAARRVYCLGDNFHDPAGPDRLEPGAAALLRTLGGATDWVWITGNHDTATSGGSNQPATTLTGTSLASVEVSGIMLRHEAHPADSQPELSGHFHPRLRIARHGRAIRRPCVVASETKLILPAFGSLTGGLDASDPAILAALGNARTIDAIVVAGDRLARFALWRGVAHAASLT